MAKAGSVPQERGREMATIKEVVEGIYSSFAQANVPGGLGPVADNKPCAAIGGFPLASTRQRRSLVRTPLVSGGRR